MEKITTNAKEGEYKVVEMEKDPFYDCSWGQINAVPEHNVYQSWCKLKDKLADCIWKLSVSWFDEDSNSCEDGGDWEQTFLSEVEAREMLASFIKRNPNYEIWWSIRKVETLADGHLERRDK